MNPPLWLKANEINVPANNAPVILFAGDTTSGLLHRAPRVWHLIDLRPLGVPADAVYAQISAHMIVTDLTDWIIENLTCTVRRPGSTLGAGNYQFQEVSVHRLDGRRGRQGGVPVGLVDGCFELYWDWTSGGAPDASDSTALINMTLDLWGAWREPPPPPSPPVAASATIPIPAGATFIQFLSESTP
jgi:hypothetical protein